MQAVRKSLIAAASVGALMAIVGASPAQAGIIDFTWNPTGAGITSGSTAFTANDITVADYANVIITNGAGNTATATESAILNVTGVNESGATVATPNLGVSGGYQLYFSVTAAATATNNGGGNYTGFFNSVTYSLIGVTGATCNFGAVIGSVSGCGTPVVLATGTLVPGQVSGNVLGSTNYVTTTPEPTAGAIVNIVTGGGAGGFFVNPLATALSSFDFITSFTNDALNITATVTGTGEHILINGGGGVINLTAVPEPLTISLFGAGLAGAAALRRRRSKKA